MSFPIDDLRPVRLLNGRIKQHSHSAKQGLVFGIELFWSSPQVDHWSFVSNFDKDLRSDESYGDLGEAAEGGAQKSQVGFARGGRQRSRAQGRVMIHHALDQLPLRNGKAIFKLLYSSLSYECYSRQ